MLDTAPRETTLLGQTVPYKTRQSTEATKPRIDVDIQIVRVVIPEEATEDPEELLAENTAWVLEKKQKYDSFREQVPDREFTAGGTFPYQDEQHEIVMEKRSTSEVVEQELRLAEHHVEQKIRSVIVRNGTIPCFAWNIRILCGREGCFWICLH